MREFGGQKKKNKKTGKALDRKRFSFINLIQGITRKLG